MNQIPEILYGKTGQKTWCIVGASRGIGLEFVRQLIAREDRILATVRDTAAVHASGLWAQAGGDHGRCQMFICDVLSEQSINVYSTLLSYHSFFSSLSFLSSHFKLSFPSVLWTAYKQHISYSDG